MVLFLRTLPHYTLATLARCHDPYLLSAHIKKGQRYLHTSLASSVLEVRIPDLALRDHCVLLPTHTVI